MTTLVTAAGGHLGRLVIDSLLARGEEPSEIIAGVRDPSKVADLEARGTRIAHVDFEEPESIAAALEGVRNVLLISMPVAGSRVALHQNVIDAAASARVAKLVYTSAPHATTADFVLAPEHNETEELIAASRVPAVIVRNNWYTENYAADLARGAETGQLAGSTGGGRVASATRADYADGIAAVLLEDGHIGEVYEFSGDHSWTFDELAATIGEIVGREVSYTHLDTAQHVAILEAAGLDAGTAGFVAAIDTGIRDGVLADADPTLSRLIGRPTTPLAEALRAIR
ncbi:SDR family oxidoreductase [Glaciibacter flavus]|uniref:SDR family oxidoreductase n=1 Tax=Orlajensenia flava TaxID=2565934 RepID=A0A4V3WU25_9MICO|nr:SDR family oxidoreductase [Glaciibacter flavus]THG34277.1 SDR family oxidoreductase [Glaciibacter flavus]